jgi:hypothetical protein
MLYQKKMSSARLNRRAFPFWPYVLSVPVTRSVIAKQTGNPDGFVLGIKILQKSNRLSICYPLLSLAHKARPSLVSTPGLSPATTSFTF